MITELEVKHLRDVITAQKKALDRLRAENEELFERVTQLKKQAMGSLPDTPIAWRLTEREEKLVKLLMARQTVNREVAMSHLYEEYSDGGAEQKILDVFICKIRKKLTPLGFILHTHWGRGWYFDTETRVAMSKACASDQSVAA